MSAEPELRRFFVPRGSLRARNVTLGPALAHRLVRVLRLRRGDHVVLSEGGPREYVVQLTGVSGNAITGVVVEERASPPEPGVTLVLYQALVRPNRFDLVLEKGTELGVSRFVPVITARSQNQGEEASAARMERWQRIVLEAAEQSERGRPPAIDAPIALEQALSGAPGTRMFPYEEDRGLGLGACVRGLVPRPSVVSLFIGPEGGFDPAEVEAAREAGAAIVSLGRRVLRSETAAIVACTIVLAELGELG